MRSVLPAAALALAAALLALAAFEGVARAVAPARPLIWPPGLSHEFRPDPAHLPGVEGPARFEVGELGLRGPPPGPDDALRLVALGGSTTECAYLDTGETWPALVAAALERTLGGSVWMGNGGRSGLRARHHVLQAAALPATVPGLDAIVLTAGVNDLLRFLREGDAGAGWWQDPRERVRVHYETFEVPTRPDFGPAWERTELVRLARLAKRRLGRTLGAGAGRTLADDGSAYARWRTERAAAAAVRRRLPDLGPALEAYRRDLVRIAGAAAEAGVEVVMVTQPALWSDDLSEDDRRLLWMGDAAGEAGPGGRPYYSAGALAEGLARFNEATLAVCRELGLRCVDAAAAIPRNRSAFYDDVHLNESGARLVAAVVAGALAGSDDVGRPGPPVSTEPEEGARGATLH